MNSTAPLLRRRAILAAATGLSLQALTSLAQTGWPQRPVKLIVPNAPSSSVDTMARILGNQLALALPQPCCPQQGWGGWRIGR